MRSVRRRIRSGESALRIILISALLLAVIVGAISISGALEDGSTYVLVLFSGFIGLQVLAILAAARRPAVGSAILIASVYAAAFSLVYFGSYPQIARLGIVLVYAAPLLGRLFFGPRVALALMAVNVVPFLLLPCKARIQVLEVLVEAGGIGHRAVNPGVAQDTATVAHAALNIMIKGIVAHGILGQLSIG